MATRLLALSAALVTLAAAPGCIKPEPPQRATAPGDGKGTEELLAGTWRLVKAGKHPAAGNVLYDFSRDGAFTELVTDPDEPPRRATGRYQLRGKTILVRAATTPEEPAETWQAVIESVTQAELVLVTARGKEQMRMTFQRAGPK